MIEAKKLTRYYGDFLAVDHLSFSAKCGEIVGLLGPNGAGKTTTMRMLTGFMPPSEGSAAIDGHDVISESLEARRRVGYLPERVPIYPDMTVRGYVQFWARLRGVRDVERQTDLILKRFSLYDRRSKLVRQLSKGMRQRLGLAQALVHNPPVIILDEPTIGIDPQQVIEVRQIVRELGRDHCVLLSTHILSEAEDICDRVLIVDQGKIVAQGTPAELQKLIRSNTYYVQIGGASEKDIRIFLKGLNGVQSVTRDGSGYLVQASGDNDLRADISGATLKSGYTLLELRQARGSLEEVFLEAVRTDESSQQPAPEHKKKR
jgi:ABC-2 type transport system ATP-binding protein